MMGGKQNKDPTKGRNTWWGKDWKKAQWSLEVQKEALPITITLGMGQ